MSRARYESRIDAFAMEAQLDAAVFKAIRSPRQPKYAESLRLRERGTHLVWGEARLGARGYSSALTRQLTS